MNSGVKRSRPTSKSCSSKIRLFAKLVIDSTGCKSARAAFYEVELKALDTQLRRGLAQVDFLGIVTTDQMLTIHRA
jgi:hypothetical protein